MIDRQRLMKRLLHQLETQISEIALSIDSTGQHWATFTTTNGVTYDELIRQNRKI